MDFPSDLKYTATHEWIKESNGKARVGVTAFAAKELSDVVFVDLPQEGKEVSAGDEICIVESVKAASSIYAPLDGTVSNVNKDLSENPALLNESCYENGWIYELDLKEGSVSNQLLSNDQYKELVS